MRSTQNYKTRRLIGILRGVSSDDFSFEEATLKGIVQHCEIHTVSLFINVLLHCESSLCR